MRYLIEKDSCAVSLEDPEITNLVVTEFPDLNQYAADFILQDSHGSQVRVYSGYLGELPVPDDETVKAIIVSNYLQPLERP